jgi:hypothetical protein
MGCSAPVWRRDCAARRVDGAESGAHDPGAGVATAMGWGLRITALGWGADLAFPRFDTGQPTVA